MSNSTKIGFSSLPRGSLVEGNGHHHPSDGIITAFTACAMVYSIEAALLVRHMKFKKDIKLFTAINTVAAVVYQLGKLMQNVQNVFGPALTSGFVVWCHFAKVFENSFNNLGNTCSFLVFMVYVRTIQRSQDMKVVKLSDSRVLYGILAVSVLFNTLQHITWDMWIRQSIYCWVSGNTPDRQQWVFVTWSVPTWIFVLVTAAGMTYSYCTIKKSRSAHAVERLLFKLSLSFLLAHGPITIVNLLQTMTIVPQDIGVLSTILLNWTAVQPMLDFRAYTACRHALAHGQAQGTNRSAMNSTMRAGTTRAPGGGTGTGTRVSAWDVKTNTGEAYAQKTQDG